MKAENFLADLNKKENYNLAIDFVLKKISTGIKGYSIQEMQSLGKIAELINNYSVYKFNNQNRMDSFNSALAQSFKDLVQKDDADFLKDIVAYYPIAVLDKLTNEFPKSKELKKIKNLKSMAQAGRDKFIYLLALESSGVLSDEAIVGKADIEKIKQEMKIADDLDERVRGKNVSSLEKLLAKLLDKKTELESKMEELTEKLGPFIQSDYSKEDIRKWLEDINDQGLFSLEDVDVDEAVKEIEEYKAQNIAEYTENKAVINQQELVYEPEIQEEEPDRVAIVETVEVETNIENPEEDIFEEKTEEQLQEDVIEEQPKIIEEQVMEEDKSLETAEHYNQDDFASKLREDHQKGMSI